jgi:hypothetical protein
LVPQWLATEMPGLKSGRGRPVCAPLAFNRCFAAAFCLALLLSAQNVACSRTPKTQPLGPETMSKLDINDVLRSRDKELLAIPGVVGVYVGVLDDGKTPCLKVMVARKTTELERRIPKSLEGYSVVIEETGIIHPMPNK